MIRDVKLWWLRQRAKRSNKNYSKYVASAKGEERESLISEAMSVRDEQRDQILTLSSLLLSDKAESLGIPVPPFGDKTAWEEGWMPGTVRLNVEAQARLRQAIRNEHREKWSIFAFVVKEIVAPVIGVIGAIMGLLSLIHALHSK
ncbi:MAG: hypothetical protein WAN06_00290 [Candidatus Sulfotelmatobacter sp.]